MFRWTSSIFLFPVPLTSLIFPLTTCSVLLSWYFLSWSHRLLLLNAVNSITLTPVKTLLLLSFLLFLLLFSRNNANVQLVRILHLFIPLILRTQLELSQKLCKKLYLLASFSLNLSPEKLWSCNDSTLPGSWLWWNYCMVSSTTWLFLLWYWKVISQGWFNWAPGLGSFWCVEWGTTSDSLSSHTYKMEN